MKIGLDCDPSKRITGKVASVANMGERRQGSDAKVFQVVVNVDNPYQSIRPGMTTSNSIETSVIHNALSLPIEAVMSEGNLAYVYKRDGGKVIRQQVELGVTSENDIVITRGLKRGDQVLLSEPADTHNLPLTRLR